MYRIGDVVFRCIGGLMLDILDPRSFVDVTAK